MDNPATAEEERPALSQGSIDNVGLSLFRRIFYVANMKEINEAVKRKHDENVNKYPYVIIDDKSILNIISKVFLTMYFSPLRDELVNKFVHAVIPLCITNPGKKQVFRFFKYPVSNIGDDAINQSRLRYRVNNMLINNSPNSIPYTDEEEKKEHEVPLVTLRPEDFPSLSN